MAIQPTSRLAGSQHILRFQGTLFTQATPGAQTVNAEVPQGAVANTATLVKFALADLTALADTTKRLPASIFDDSVPAGSSPHSNLAPSGPSIAGVPAGKTFAQNIKVRAHEDAPSSASPLIAAIYVLSPAVEIDTATTGLSQSSGVPVVGVSFFFTADGITALGGEQPVGVPIVLEVEVPHTLIR